MGSGRYVWVEKSFLNAFILLYITSIKSSLNKEYLSTMISVRKVKDGLEKEQRVIAKINQAGGIM